MPNLQDDPDYQEYQDYIDYQKHQNPEMGQSPPTAFSPAENQEKLGAGLKNHIPEALRNFITMRDSAVSGMLKGATGGLVDQNKLTHSAEEHPDLNMAGELVGAGAMGGLAGAGIGGLMGGGKLANMAGNAISGAAQGYGLSEGDKAAGATAGGLIGGAASGMGAAGSALAKAGPLAQHLMPSSLKALLGMIGKIK